MRQTLAIATFHCLLVLGPSTAAFAEGIPVTQAVKDTGKLTIASSLGYAPFEYVDENGMPAGLDIELATAVAKLVGAQLNIDTVPFANQIPGLTAGRFKIAWATFSVTAERLKEVDFVTFMQAGTVVVTKPEQKEKFAETKALCGARVAVQAGTAADFSADKLIEACKADKAPPPSKAIYPEQKDVVQSVLSGRADAYLDDSTSAGYYAATTGGKMVIAGKSFFPTPLGIAVAKGDRATEAMMKAAFEKLMADGTYKSILQKYSMTTSAAEEIIVYTDASQLAK